MNDVQDTLIERAATHGDYTMNAKIAQTIKTVMQSSPNWSKLRAYQAESLELIATKIGRLLSGDFDHIDSWHDIAGYAALVETELNQRALVETNLHRRAVDITVNKDAGEYTPPIFRDPPIGLPDD